MATLDKALEDIIKDNKGSRGRSDRHDGRRSGGSRKPDHNLRHTPYGGHDRSERNVNQRWGHDKFNDDDRSNRGSITSRLGPRASNSRFNSSGSAITLKNLHYEVTEKDLEDLFRSVGTVDKAKINFDNSGRSKGEANVFFSATDAAERAIKKYNGVELDGVPLEIELREERPRSGGPIRSGRPSRSYGSRDSHRGKSGGRPSSYRKQKSQTELDEELDSYNKSAQTGQDGDVEML